MSHRVLVISEIIPAEGIELLRSSCEVKTLSGVGEDALIHEINDFGADVIYTRSERITQRIIRSCPSLKIIQTNGIGVDHIDCDAAAMRGIAVLNVPDVTPGNVAEHTIALLLALSRHLRTVHRQATEGGIAYPYPASLRVQREIEGKTLLLAGMGNIGCRVAKKALALDLKVIAYDAFVSQEKMEALGVIRAESWDEALGQADYVSLHLPCTKETCHMMGARQFAAMKKDAFFINVSRGPLVDEAALIEALQNDQIAGAGLDVFEEEPLPVNHPLTLLDQVILSPHCAGTTVGCNIKAALRAGQSILDALNGKNPGTLVNGKLLAETGLLPAFCRGERK